MPIDFRDIPAAARRILLLVEDSERRKTLEQFMDSSSPLVESAAREAIQELVDEINVQLAPHSHVRLVQSANKITAEVVQAGSERGRRGSYRLDGDTVSKVLFRIPSTIKDMAAESAKKAGMSLNSWTVDILERAIDNLADNRKDSEADRGEPSDVDGQQTEANPASSTDSERIQE